MKKSTVGKIHQLVCRSFMSVHIGRTKRIELTETVIMGDNMTCPTSKRGASWLGISGSMFVRDLEDGLNSQLHIWEGKSDLVGNRHQMAHPGSPQLSCTTSLNEKHEMPKNG